MCAAIITNTWNLGDLEGSDDDYETPRASPAAGADLEQSNDGYHTPPPPPPIERNRYAKQVHTYL